MGPVNATKYLYATYSVFGYSIKFKILFFFVNLYFEYPAKVILEQNLDTQSGLPNLTAAMGIGNALRKNTKHLWSKFCLC